MMRGTTRVFGATLAKALALCVADAKDAAGLTTADFVHSDWMAANYSNWSEKPMKLLFPVDGSDCALTALDKFASIVPLFCKTPELVLINVQLPLPYPRAIALVGKEVVAQYYEEQSEEALAGACKRLEQSGFTFRVEKRIGDPAQEIVHFAELEQCEMIAMGTHGRTALKNLVMGSVATKVLATSNVPVLFLK